MAEAVKNDQGKTMMGLLPPDALEETAKVFTYGAKKYSPYNWAAGSGFPYSRLYDALQRHLNAFWSGEDFDEVGNYHLACACCNVMMLLSTYLRGIGADDRPFTIIKKINTKPLSPKESMDIEHCGVSVFLDGIGDNGKFSIDVTFFKDGNDYKYKFEHFKTDKQMMIVSNHKLTSNELQQVMQMIQEMNQVPSNTLKYMKSNCQYWIQDVEDTVKSSNEIVVKVSIPKDNIGNDILSFDVPIAVERVANNYAYTFKHNRIHEDITLFSSDLLSPNVLNQLVNEVQRKSVNSKIALVKLVNNKYEVIMP